MKKTYKIDVDCANCANKMEEAAKNTAGVEDATVNFMMLKMIVEFEDGQDPKTESGESSCIMIRSRVVLPAPLLPMRAAFSRSSIWKLASLRMIFSPKDLQIF